MFICFTVCLAICPIIHRLSWKRLISPAVRFFLVQSAGDFFTTAISNEAVNQGGIGLLLIATLAFGWKLVEKIQNICGLTY